MLTNKRRFYLIIGLILGLVILFYFVNSIKDIRLSDGTNDDAKEYSGSSTCPSNYKRCGVFVVVLKRNVKDILL